MCVCTMYFTQQIDGHEKNVSFLGLCIQQMQTQTLEKKKWWKKTKKIFIYVKHL